jgi:hypothetical protein
MQWSSNIVCYLECSYDIKVYYAAMFNENALFTYFSQPHLIAHDFSLSCLNRGM